MSVHLLKKGFLGYKAEDVERYIAVTQKALAIKEPAQLHTNTKELMHLIQELRNKQSQEKQEINKILSSPNALKRRLAQLKKKEKIKQMKQERKLIP